MLLFLSLDGFKQGLSDWAPAAEVGVAIGTILLAFATFKVAERARDQLTLAAPQVA